MKPILSASFPLAKRVLPPKFLNYDIQIVSTTSQMGGKASFYSLDSQDTKTFDSLTTKIFNTEAGNSVRSLVTKYETDLNFNSKWENKSLRELLQCLKNDFIPAAPSDNDRCWRLYSQIGDLDPNLKVLVAIFLGENNQISRSHLIFTSILQSQEFSQEWRKFLAIAWGKVIKTLARRADANCIYQSLQFMIQEGINPTENEYNKLLRVFMDKEDLENAFALYQKMKLEDLLNSETAKILLLGEKSSILTSQKPNFIQSILQEFDDVFASGNREAEQTIIAYKILSSDLEPEKAFRQLENNLKHENSVMNVLELLVPQLQFWKWEDLLHPILTYLTKSSNVIDERRKYLIGCLCILCCNAEMIRNVSEIVNMSKDALATFLLTGIVFVAKRGQPIEPLLVVLKKENIRPPVTFFYEYLREQNENWNSYSQINLNNLMEFHLTSDGQEDLNGVQDCILENLTQKKQSLAFRCCLKFLYYNLRPRNSDLRKYIFKQLIVKDEISSLEAFQMYSLLRETQKDLIRKDISPFLKALETKIDENTSLVLSLILKEIKLEKLETEQFYELYRTLIANGLPGRVIETLDHIVQRPDLHDERLINTVLEAFILTPHSHTKASWFWRQLESSSFKFNDLHLKLFIVVLCSNELSHTAAHFVRIAKKIYNISLTQSDLLGIQDYITPEMVLELEPYCSIGTIPKDSKPTALFGVKNSDQLYEIKRKWNKVKSIKNDARALYKLYHDFLKDKYFSVSYRCPSRYP